MFFPNLKKIIVRPPRALRVFQLGGKRAFFPLFYLVHLTLACNARCSFCYQDAPIFDASRKDFFKIDDFEMILKQAKEFIFKRPLIYFFGGEPLIHPQFTDFLELTEKYRFLSALTTNGILLGKYLKPISAARHLNQLTVSLQGIGEVHDRLVGRSGVFEEIISALHHFKSSKKIINITCVIAKENRHQLLDLADFLNRSLAKKISALVFRYPMGAFSPGSEDRHFQSVVRKLKNAKFNFPVFFSAENWSATSGVPSSFFRGNCYLPWLGLGILPNLDVMPGGSVLTCAEVIGNLNERGLKDIWNGGELRNLRAKILNNGLPSSCWGCCHGYIKSSN